MSVISDNPGAAAGIAIGGAAAAPLLLAASPFLGPAFSIFSSIEGMKAARLAEDLQKAELRRQRLLAEVDLTRDAEQHIARLEVNAAKSGFGFGGSFAALVGNAEFQLNENIARIRANERVRRDMIGHEADAAVRAGAANIFKTVTEIASLGMNLGLTAATAGASAGAVNFSDPLLLQQTQPATGGFGAGGAFKPPGSPSRSSGGIYPVA